MFADPRIQGLIASRLGHASMDPNYEVEDPRRIRVKDIEENWQQFPGAAPGGTGPTGLMSSDSKGWSDLMNQQSEHQNLLNELSGKGPMKVERGQDMGGMPPSIADDPNSSFNLNPYSPGNTENIHNAQAQARSGNPAQKQLAIQGLRKASPWGLG